MKKSLNLLQELVRKCAILWDDQMATTASVAIQNMTAHANEWKWEQFNPYLEILNDMKALRPDNHVIAWAHSEAKMIIDNHFMSFEFGEEGIKYEDLVLGTIYATDFKGQGTYVFRHSSLPRNNWLRIGERSDVTFIQQGTNNFKPINGHEKFRKPTNEEYNKFIEKENNMTHKIDYNSF
jgi:hypothetical protein